MTPRIAFYVFKRLIDCKVLHGGFHASHNKSFLSFAFFCICLPGKCLKFLNFKQIIKKEKINVMGQKSGSVKNYDKRRESYIFGQICEFVR